MKSGGTLPAFAVGATTRDPADDPNPYPSSEMSAGLLLLVLKTLGEIGAVSEGIIGLASLWRRLTATESQALEKAYVRAYESVVSGVCAELGRPCDGLERMLNRSFTLVEDELWGEGATDDYDLASLELRLTRELQLGFAELPPVENEMMLDPSGVVGRWRGEFILSAFRDPALHARLQAHDSDLLTLVAHQIGEVLAEARQLDPERVARVAVAKLCADIFANYAGSVDEWYQHCVGVAVAPDVSPLVHSLEGPRSSKRRVSAGDAYGTTRQHAARASRPVSSVVDDCTRGIFLSGEPGAGKTTALRWLTHRLGSRIAGGKTLGEDEWSLEIPVYAELGRLRDIRVPRPLDALLSEFILEHSETSAYVRDRVENAIDFLRDLRPRVRLVLMLDGLDRAYERADDVLEYVHRAVARGDKVILSSRPGYRAPSSDLEHHTLVGLETAERQIDYLSAYEAAVHGCTGDGDKPRCAECVARAARSLRSIVGVAPDTSVSQNPLHLFMAWSVVRNGAPAERMNYAELYLRFVDIALEKTRSGGELFDTVLGPCKRTLAAWWYADKARGTLFCGLPFPENRDRWLNQQLLGAPSDELFEKLSQCTSLLDYHQRSLIMLHPTFEEYFAAWWLIEERGLEGLRELTDEWLVHPSWDEVVVFCAGLIEDESARERLYGAALSWDAALALRCVKEWGPSEVRARAEQLRASGVSDVSVSVAANDWPRLLHLIRNQPGTESGVAAADAIVSRPKLSAKQFDTLLGFVRAQSAEWAAGEIAQRMAARDDLRSEQFTALVSFVRDQPAAEAAARAGTAVALRRNLTDDQFRELTEFLDDQPQGMAANEVARALATRAALAPDGFGALVAFLRDHPVRPWRR